MLSENYEQGSAKRLEERITQLRSVIERSEEKHGHHVSSQTERLREVVRGMEAILTRQLAEG